MAKEALAEAGDQGCGERGSGSIAALGIVAALLLVFAVLAGLIAVVSANQRAASAADLSALAAADAARGLRGGEPCQVAAEIAAANKAEVVGCNQPAGSAGTVDVRVQVRITGIYALLGPAEGVSRAGPPDGF